MAEKRDYNVSLNSKGLEASVSEDQARRICNTQGQHSLFLIDAHHGPYVTNEDGTIKMNLIIDGAELVPVEHEDRVRRFMRALYLARPDQFGQQAFETDEDGPTVDDAAAQVDALVETDEDGTVLGVWDPESPDAAAGPWPGDPDFPEAESNVVSANFSST